MKKTITFNNRTYLVTTKPKVTLSKKTRRPKYGKCMCCRETKYVQRHHIQLRITVPLCPKCHARLHAGDMDIKLK